MDARKLMAAAVAMPLLIAGCAIEPSEFDALKEQVRVQQKQINDLKARQEEQSLRLDTLNNGFKILGDKAEENSQRIDDLSGQPRSSLVAEAPPPPAPAATVVTTPAALVSALASPPPPAPAPLVASAPVPVPEPVLLTNLPKTGASAAPPEGEIITAGPKAEKLYAGALALFSSREYAQAGAKFAEFVVAYPDHKLAGNAQYWIGECSYSQKKFAEAAEEFAKVEKSYPASPKVPAALLKKGLSLYEIKRMQEAQAALQRIIDKHPQSEEAAKARERLERWKQ